MSDVYIGLIGLAALLALFMTGIELSFAMAVIGCVGSSIVRSFESGLDLLATDVFDMFSSYGLSVVPLFVLMGQIAFNAGIARRIYTCANKFLGHVPGGLAIATVAGASAFKAICGSAPATAATFASIAVPEMDKFGYNRKISTGIVASVGTLGVLIPPSVALIVFGIITEQSIGKLFLAGVIPGLIIAVFFVVIIYGWCRLNPAMGPKGGKSTWEERFRSLPEVLWVLLIFVLVVGGLMQGFFTPTEAGSVGTMGVLVLSVLKKDIGLRGFVQSLGESLRTACMVLVLVTCSAIFGHFLTVTKITMLASDWVASLPLNRYIILVIIVLIYQIGGSFIEDFAFLMLVTTIFYPAAIKLGFDPIWFGIIIMINLGLGCVIPPMALNVFIVKNITKEPLGVIYKGVYPFLISLFVTGALLFIFPQLATFLPNLLMK
ncbi:MAG: TRAP transporter large permease [candidate division WOR-3 bacterium]